MLTQYTLKMPHAVYSGKDALDKLTQIIGTGVKNRCFTDRGIIGDRAFGVASFKD